MTTTLNTTATTTTAKTKEEDAILSTRIVPISQKLDENSRLALASFIAVVEQHFFQFDFINCDTVDEFGAKQSKLLHALSEQHSLCKETSDLIRRSMLEYTMQKLIKAYKSNKTYRSSGKRVPVTPATIDALIGPQEMQKRKSMAMAEARDVMACTCRWLAGLWQTRACTLYVYNRNQAKLREFAGGRLQYLDIMLLLALAVETRQEFDALVRDGSLAESTLFAPFTQVLLMQVEARKISLPPPYLCSSVPCEVIGCERFIDHLSYFCSHMNDGKGEPALCGADLVLIRRRLVLLWRLYWFAVYEAAGYRLADNPAYAALFECRWVLRDGAAAARALARLYQYVRNVVHEHKWLNDHMILHTWCDRIADLQVGLSAAQFWVVGIDRAGMLDAGEDALRAEALRGATSDDTDTRWNNNDGGDDSEERRNTMILWLSQVHGNDVVKRLIEIGNLAPPSTNRAPSPTSSSATSSVASSVASATRGTDEAANH